MRAPRRPAPLPAAHRGVGRHAERVPGSPARSLRPALREGAASLVLIHNHPSGDPTPSREDIRLTRQLVDAGRLLDLPVHDHVIVGNGPGAWVSFTERGLL
jgi:DNA repair protein RadC